MRFAGAGWPKSKAVLAPLDPLAARQFENQRLIQRRLGGEVERIEALGLWKARQPNARSTLRRSRSMRPNSHRRSR